MKRGLAVLLFICLMGAQITWASEIPDEMQANSYKFSEQTKNDHLGYLAFPRASGLDVRDSFLLGMTIDASGKPTSVSTCDSISDLDCLKMSDFTVAAILPSCSPLIISHCIKEFYAETSDGKRLEVIDKGPFTAFGANHFSGDQTVGIPNGGAPHLYQIPRAPHEAGDLYLAIASRSGHWSRSEPKMVDFDNTSITLYAVKIVNGSFTLFTPSTDVDQYLTRNQVNTLGADVNCVYNDDNSCAVAVSLPDEIRFGFQVSYPSLAQKWFHGRVENANVKVMATREATVVDISAKSANSSGFFLLKKRSEIPRALVDAEAAKIGKGSCTGESPEASCYDSNLWQTNRDMETFLQWLDLAGDKATFDPTIWTVNAMNQNLEHPQASFCSASSSGLVGLVSTNATQYLAGPPLYDQSSGELRYKVAAPHLRSDGSLFRGSYELVMDAKYASCLYSLAGNAIRASISITSESGRTVAATTNQGVREGWLYLSAKDFTFSSPTIGVRLSTASSNSNTSSIIDMTANVKTLKCVKGPKVVKVKGKSASCPKGYKKK